MIMFRSDDISAHDMTSITNFW